MAPTGLASYAGAPRSRWPKFVEFITSRLSSLFHLPNILRLPFKELRDSLRLLGAGRTSRPSLRVPTDPVIAWIGTTVAMFIFSSHRGPLRSIRRWWWGISHDKGEINE
jgi:hypothetical protein